MTPAALRLVRPRRSEGREADPLGLFDRVVLIYNPLNRRVPLTRAEAVRAELARRLPDLPVTLLATERAGHAEQLAGREAASGRPLLVAVSGDGVYSEVVNGVLSVAGSRALTAVVAGGNANDHRRSTRRMSIGEAIVAAHRTGRARYLDVLQVSISPGAGDPSAGSWSRYAHSYVGFGLTPLMAIGLERDRKGSIAELASVLRTFTELAPVQIQRSSGRTGRPDRYDSLIFANIDRMAKYGRVDRSGGPDDGKFEVLACRHGHRWRIAAMALRAVSVGLRISDRVDRVAFTVVDAAPVQIDGELAQLAAGSQITIDCVPRALATVG